MLLGASQVVGPFVHQPLQESGLFDSIAYATIFRVIPFKTVEGQTVASSIYQPITRPDEIRLIILEPGAPGDPLECHLINVQLSWRTKYEALSYAWGDASITRPLACSGRSIDVAASLHDALTDLRLPQSRRYLWVDAVCINQADNEEKAKQIMLMRHIYSAARRVLIYLGKMDPSVDGALRDLARLDWAFLPLHIRRFCSREGMAGLITRLPEMKPIEDDAFDWAPVISLLQRPWFQRTWVIQEAVLAKRALVICGDQSVAWAVLERVALSINAYHGFVKSVPGYDKIDRAMHAVNLVRSARRDAYRSTPVPWLLLLHPPSLRSRREYSKLLDLVQETRVFGCTDPRDKIYGMLGITREDTRSGYLVPDYRNSPGQVYWKFVLWEILHNRSLRVLSLTSDKASGGAEFASPSWVPDFTRLDVQSPLTRYEKRMPHSAGPGDLAVEARASGDGTVLYLKGRMVDTLHTVAKWSANSFPDGMSREATNPELAGRISLTKTKLWITEAMGIWRAAVQRRTNRWVSPLVVTDLWATSKDGRFTASPACWTHFLRTILCDRTYLSQPLTAADLHVTAGIVRGVVSRIPMDKIFSPEAMPQYHESIQALERAGQSRRFASTGAGLAGFVPTRARKGDVVVILYGSSVPFVLRPAADGKYSLVGECYMHGLMQGLGGPRELARRGYTEQEFAII